MCGAATSRVVPLLRCGGLFNNNFNLATVRAPALREELFGYRKFSDNATVRTVQQRPISGLCNHTGARVDATSARQVGHIDFAVAPLHFRFGVDFCGGLALSWE